MHISKQANYAMRALAYLAEQPGRLIPIHQVGEAICVPLPFLAKIFSTLSRAGLVTARRGPKGGVTLCRPASQVSLGQVVHLIDGARANGHCFLGLGACSERNPCPVHNGWHEAHERLSRSLRERTIEDLCRFQRESCRS
jgi:Rrf2 family protein